MPICNALSVPDDSADPAGSPQVYAEAERLCALLASVSLTDAPDVVLEHCCTVLKADGYRSFVRHINPVPVLTCHKEQFFVSLLFSAPDLRVSVTHQTPRRGPRATQWPANMGGRGNVVTLAVPRLIVADVRIAAQLLAWHRTPEQRLLAFQRWLAPTPSQES